MRWEGEVPSGWRGFWRRRRWSRQARRKLRALFDDPQHLAGTSLRRSHRGRVDLHSLEIRGDAVLAFTFTILRHPRPYPFSRQFHQVVESYRYAMPNGPLRRGKSLNLSRLAQRDGEPPGGAV